MYIFMQSLGFTQISWRITIIVFTAEFTQIKFVNLKKSLRYLRVNLIHENGLFFDIY